ncbi:MAG: hypothetical protein LBO78_01190 [Rickettsiales bacterium]|jgi:hypothetical protein|nr:hypothetical protein [Rickettsiales bacterium]
MKQKLKDSCESLSKAANGLAEAFDRLMRDRVRGGDKERDRLVSDLASARRKIKRAAEEIKSLAISLKNGEA